MIHRIFPTKDTFITNAQVNCVQMTGSNVGGSETLDVFKVAGMSGATGVPASASIARVLLCWDMDEISALTSSGEMPTSGSVYKLRLKNARTNKTLPSSYTLIISPLTRSWDEGRGVDVDALTDSGFANWDKAKQGTYWTTAGGDFEAPSRGRCVSQSFDAGDEDLFVDVTTLVGAWLTGSLTNHGIIVALSGTAESTADYTDYYLKRFYGRGAWYPDRWPYIEASWDDSVKDDRSFARAGGTAKLCLYNSPDGVLTDLSADAVTVRIAAATLSSSVIAYATASRVSVGVYSASLSIPVGTAKGTYYDMWQQASASLMTGTVAVVTGSSFTSLSPQRYLASMRNLRDEYTRDETPRIDVRFRKSTYRPNWVLTGSGVATQVVKRAYYAIDNDVSKERIIGFGTGSVETTRISYDESGNYFHFRMSTLSAGNVYKIVLLVMEDGRQHIVDEGYRFKVI
jgi:hypothetical protein